MKICVTNSTSSLEGADAWFLGVIARHLSFKVERGTPLGSRLGFTFEYEGETWGSLVRGNVFASGLAPHVEALCRHYNRAVEVVDLRIRPEEDLPWWSLTAQWRPYQDAVHKALLGSERGVIDAPPRSGKTLMAGRLIDNLAQPTVYLAPSVSIVEQTYRVLCFHFGEDLVARLDGGAKSHEKDISKPVVVATAQSAIRQSQEWWDTRKLLIIDEFHHCLSPTTRVLTNNGWRAISTLRVGDLVWSQGPQGLDLREVRKVWVRKPPQQMLRIRTTVGMLEVTSEHKIYTREGKVRAGDLRAGSEVQVLQMRSGDNEEGTVRSACRRLQGACEEHSGLPEVRSLCAEEKLRRASNELPGEELPFRPGDSPSRYGEKIPEPGVSETAVRSDDGEEPHEKQRIQESDDCGRQEGDSRGADGPLRTGHRRERDASDRIGEKGGYGAALARLCARAQGADRSLERARSRNVVQPRLGGSKAYDCCRDRRIFPSESCRSGCSKGPLASRGWLGCDPCACRSDRRCASVVEGRVLEVETIEASCSEVYDLEVAENHNYLAEGVLVSNSAANLYHEINLLARAAYYRYCFTGTHFRTGEDRLAMEAVSSRVLARIPVAGLVQGGYLAPARVVFSRSGGPSVASSDWRQVYRKGIVQNDQRNERIAWTAQQLTNMGLPTIVLVRWVEHAKALSEAIPGSAMVRGGCAPLSSRTIKQFREGAVNCLVGTTVIGEGVDLPQASALVFASAGGPGVQTIQSYFRPLTVCPGKEQGLIYDFTDTHHPMLARWAQGRRALAKEVLGEECVIQL